MCSAHILMTGATGNLGNALLWELLREPGQCSVTVIVRPGRADYLQWQLAKRGLEDPSRMHVVEGDIRRPFCGLADVPLPAPVTDAIHCAADIRWDAAPTELFETNVSGTRNFLDLTDMLHRRNPLRAVSIVSTAYVCGTRAGRIAEDGARFGAFNNSYEISKWLAERIAAVRRPYHVYVVRPSTIVGDERDGTIQSFSGIYYPIKLFWRRRMRWFVGKSNATLDIVPVDQVARTLLRAHESLRTDIRFIHACAGMDAPTLKQVMLEIISTLGGKTGRRSRRAPRLLRPALVRTVAPLAPFLPSKAGRALKNAAIYSGYVGVERTFDNENARQLGFPRGAAFKLSKQADFAIAHEFASAERRFQQGRP